MKEILTLFHFVNKINFNIIYEKKLPIASYDKIQHTFNENENYLCDVKIFFYEEMNELFHTNTTMTFFFIQWR